MIGHLGPRTSALLDGQLSPADEERAWEHVHGCHLCRDAVEREGYVKTRLASMQQVRSPAPSHLKGSLMFAGVVGWPLPDDLDDDGAARRRHLGLVGIGTGAVGAAVMGVLALGASPANAPGVIDPTSTTTVNNPFTSVTAIIDRDQPSHQRSTPGAPPSRRLAGHTLAP